jgi:hypothetical protein
VADSDIANDDTAGINSSSAAVDTVAVDVNVADPTHDDADNTGPPMAVDHVGSDIASDNTAGIDGLSLTAGDTVDTVATNRNVADPAQDDAGNAGPRIVADHMEQNRTEQKM